MSPALRPQRRPMRLKRAKVQSQSLANRLAGVSILGFGASWKAPEPDRVVVRDVITELEDKRALYSQAVWEEPHHVVQSILKIREVLTNGLKRVSDKSPAKDSIRIMRATCRDFLTQSSTKKIGDRSGMLRLDGMWEQEEFFIGLGRLRSIFGQQLAILGYLYGIDIEEQLAAILPPDWTKDST